MTLSSGSLTVAGSGIKTGLHTTPEALRAIESAEKVLYLFTDQVPAEWIRSLNPSAESLDRFYSTGKDRAETYREMVEEILSWVRRGLAVCAVFYGHPGVFVAPSHEAIRRARGEGFPARMLPAISAEDCLFADLGIDPGESGCQSYEATDFLLSNKTFDTSTPLVLWQVAGVGVRRGASTASLAGLRLLADVLGDRYTPEHEVVLYQASPYPIFDPIVQRTRLRELPSADVTPMCTLYVPPNADPQTDPKMRARLEAIGLL